MNQFLALHNCKVMIKWPLACNTTNLIKMRYSNNVLKPESRLLYDWRFTANQFVLVPNTLRPTAINLLFQLNPCSYSPYVTSSLMRGWVYCSQLLLNNTSAIILGSKSCGTHDHILLSQIRDSPILEGQVPVFISPRNRVAQLQYNPRQWVPFPSPDTWSSST
jgi:hypothetical protein